MYDNWSRINYTRSILNIEVLTGFNWALQANAHQRLAVKVNQGKSYIGGQP